MGPVMNLVARDHRDGGRALSGRHSAGVRAAAGRRSARSRRIGRRASRPQARRSHRRRRRQPGRELGRVLDGDRAEGQRKVTIGYDQRDGSARSSHDASAPAASTRAATSASCRPSAPTIDACQPGQPRSEAGLQRGDVILARQRRDATCRASASSKLIRASAGKPLTLDQSRAAGQEHRSHVTPTNIDGTVVIGVQISPFGESHTVKPGVASRRSSSASSATGSGRR